MSLAPLLPAAQGRVPLLAPRSDVVDPDRATARRWAVEELSDREYVQAQPGPLQQALLWLLDRLGELLDRTGEVSSGAGLVVGVLVVLAVVVLALVLAGPLRRGGRRRRGGADPVFGSVVRSAAEHRAASEQAAAAAAWTVAVQERFRAAARTLEERVLLDARPGRTADEVAREGGAVLPGAAAALARAARAFDEVTYGERDGDEAGYAAGLEADEQVRRGRPAAVPASTGATVVGT